MSCSLRAATMADYEGLCALYAEVDAMHREALPHLIQRPKGPPRPRDYISKVLADEEQAIFVAESGSRMVGFVHVIARKAPDIPLLVPRRFAAIDDIVVTGEFRNRGIGRALIGKAHEWAAEKGLGAIELNVWEFNQGAIGFYEKLGYATVSRRMRMPLK